MTEYAVNENGCWIWLGKTTGYGYGAIVVNNCSHAAHRVFYERAKGKIPSGLVLDHLCRDKKCVNPAHLEPVTNRENVLRGIGPTAINAAKTHCPKGHPYDGNNLSIRRGSRYCNECDRKHKSNWHLKNPRQVAARRRELAGKIDT